MSDPYDTELALRSLTRERRKRDPVTIGITALGDRMAASISSETPTEALEAAGLALIQSTARLGGLLVEGMAVDEATRSTVTLLLNVQGFAGERLVRDARAIDEVGA